MKVFLRRLFYLLIAIGIVGAIVFASLPKPVAVDLATVTREPLMVTVDEDGRTRIREKYVVSAPLNGRLLRIDLEPGDHVTGSKTLLASIEPGDPQLLDARSQAEAEASEMRAEASLKKADPALQQARVELEHAEIDVARKRKMRNTNAISQEQLDDAELLFRSKSEAFRSAKFAQEIAAHELELAKAALMHTRSGDHPTKPSDWQFEIRSPIDGVVLKVSQESSAIINPGMPLLEIGDPSDLEIEIDVLSSDAVKIKPGDRVIIEHWGGTQSLEGRVNLVEPSAFTKISALGVEEQRVWVIVEIMNPPEERTTLGDGYRIEGRIVIWSHDDVLQIPTSALFRDENHKWAVFLVKDEKVERVTVEIGHSNGLHAEVLSGLTEGDRIVIHPSDQVQHGVMVTGR